MASALSVSDPWNLVADGYTEIIVPSFENWAKDAIERLELTSPARVLDMACGPGTASVLLARNGHEVEAIDFSERMLANFERRLKNEPLAIRLHHMDGQNLTFEAECFDAAVSMFGLMFFPDRARGFAELYRVVRPGGRVAVSSWAPVAESPCMQWAFGAVRALLQEESSKPQGSDIETLEDPEVFRRELEAAGFVDVDVVSSRHGFSVPEIDQFWDAMVISSAPIAMLKEKLGEEEWKRREPLALQYLRETDPGCPTELTSTAWIGTGRKA